MDGSRGWIIEWRTNIYRGLAGGHITADGYGGEHWFVIAFRVREKRGMGGILGIVNNVVVHGHFEHVLDVDFWRRIGKVRVYRRDVGLDWKVRIVKGVRIVGLYREGHGNWRRVVVGESRRMVRVCRVERLGVSRE
jgi:hypothetical protein